MRLFYFENEKGNRMPLNNENGIFLYSPDGLGVSYSNNYNSTGLGFFIRVKDGLSQNEITFTLVYPPGDDSPYERYRSLMDWIFSSEKIYFVYCPYGGTEYYRNVEISSIGKSELDMYGALQSEVSVLPLTPWYIPSPIVIDFNHEEEGTMRYDFYYDDDLIYGEGKTNYVVNVVNTGHMPAAIHFSFSGEVNNPVLTLRGSDSRKEYGVCTISESFRTGDTLEFSTAEQDSYVKKIDKDGTVTDLLDKIDITTNPFFRVPLNEPCEVSISAESIYGDATMTLYIYYRGV